MVCFPGPVAWTNDSEVSPRVDVPRRVLESEPGVEFLRRLGVEPPEELQAMSVEVNLKPHLNFRLVKRGSADSEVVHGEVQALDDERTRTEVLEKDHWALVERQDPVPGRLTVVDRTLLNGILKLMDSGGFVWDGPAAMFPQPRHQDVPREICRMGWPLCRHTPPLCWIQNWNRCAMIRSRAAVRFELAEATEIDWFDLKILVDVQGLTLTKAQIRDLVAARGGFVRMPDGKWMRLSLSLTDEQQASITRLGLDVYDLSGRNASPPRLAVG